MIRPTERFTRAATMSAAGPSGPVADSASGPHRPVTIPETRVHSLHSTRVDAQFELWIGSPVGGLMGLPSGPYDVLYVLDANLFFGTAVEMTRIMHQLFGELPPLLVVGIAYDAADPAVQAELRARDFTPTADAGFEETARSFPGARAPTLPEGRRLGRAAQFLAFLEEEVKVFVEATFPVVEGGSVLWGSSLGGLFTLYALLERPHAFGAYVATSPAIWWDGDWLLSREAELAKARDDLASTLVLVVGGDEERPDVPRLARYKLIGNVQTLAERLLSRGYPSLNVTTLVLEGESHTTVVPSSMTRGLRAIYASSRGNAAR